MESGPEEECGRSGGIGNGRGGSGLGFHFWFPSLLCLSIFNNSDYDKDCFLTNTTYTDDVINPSKFVSLLDHCGFYEPLGDSFLGHSNR